MDKSLIDSMPERIERVSPTPLLRAIAMKPAFRGTLPERFCILLIACLGPMALGSSCVVADDAITIKQVVNAWRSREQRVKSFRFQWAEDHFQAKGSSVLPQAPQYEGVVFPARDTPYHVDSGCEMDRHMMRYSFSGESLQVYNDGALELREYVSASDGDVSKAFWALPNKLRNYPKGVIFDEKLCSDAGTLDVKPLLWLYRALDPRFAFSEQSLQLSRRSGIVDGKACAIVACAKGETEYSIWTDPARDFVPLRFTIASTTTGKVTTQADITHQKDPSRGWTPTGWTIVRTSAGNLQHSIVARVTNCAINVEIPKSRFQIEFPPGTIVIDMTNRGERYLVGADGSKQIPPDTKK
jgi:hypothetical protein